MVTGSACEHPYFNVVVFWNDNHLFDIDYDLRMRGGMPTVCTQEYGDMLGWQSFESQGLGALNCERFKKMIPAPVHCVLEPHSVPHPLSMYVGNVLVRLYSVI